MTKLRVVPYRKLRKVAESAGFRWIRCVGSHNVFQNPEGVTVVMPDHGSEVIVRPLLRKILRDMGLSVDEYHEILEKM